MMQEEQTTPTEQATPITYVVETHQAPLDPPARVSPESQEANKVSLTKTLASTMIISTSH
jgi:hypothetical protein